MTAKKHGKKITTRKNPPRKIVIDWSGDELGGEEFASIGREFSGGCHIYIDYDGTIWQFADLFDKVSRGGWIDSDAIWIVLQNKGAPPQNKKFPRGTFRMEVNDLKVSALASTTEQLEALEQLILLVCDSLQLAPNVPRDGNYEVLRGEVSKRMVKDHEVILAAFHLKSTTVSPGPGVIEILDELEQHFSDLEEEEDDDDEEEGDEDLDGVDESMADA